MCFNLSDGAPLWAYLLTSTITERESYEIYGFIHAAKVCMETWLLQWRNMREMDRNHNEENADNSKEIDVKSNFKKRQTYSLVWNEDGMLLTLLLSHAPATVFRCDRKLWLSTLQCLHVSPRQKSKPRTHWVRKIYHRPCLRNPMIQSMIGCTCREPGVSMVVWRQR